MRERLETGTLSHHRLSTAERERAIRRVSETLTRVEGVLFAYLFGSFLGQRPFGDVDVAVYLDPRQYTELDALATQLHLAACLEAASELPVDVVILNDAPLGLRIAAAQGRLVFSSGENSYLAFAESTGLQAMDTAYLRRQSVQDVLAPAERS